MALYGDRFKICTFLKISCVCRLDEHLKNYRGDLTSADDKNKICRIAIHRLISTLLAKNS